MNSVVIFPMSELPAFLRALRKRRGFTLKEVANLAGISFSFLSDVERGRTNPSMDTLSRLAGVYRMQISIAISED